MKRVLALLISLLFVAGASVSCGKSDASTERYDYDLSRYIQVGELSELAAAYPDPSVCTTEEVDEAQLQVLLSYASFEEKAQGVVERYNKVEILYQMFRGDEEMKDYTEEAYQIIVGSDGFGDMDKLMGETLIGARVGEEREAEYTFPKEDASIGGWAGLTVTLKGKVKAIYQHYLPECNEDFVSGLEGEGGTFASVASFRLALEESILSQKAAARDQAVFLAYMDSVEVKKYPKEELNAYVERGWNEATAAAEQLGVPLEQYLAQYLATTEDAYEKLIQEKAKEQTKNDMACIQLSRLMGTELSEAEYKEGLERLFEAEGGVDESGYGSVEEFEAAYTPKEIRESLLWEKSFQQLVQQVKRLEP
ncbi:MAG: hypothetical protein IKJ74_02955 [Clostridia bacterium]|nr:hypothetical protein [Clostridia bacterium]